MKVVLYWLIYVKSNYGARHTFFLARVFICAKYFASWWSNLSLFFFSFQVGLKFRTTKIQMFMFLVSSAYMYCQCWVFHYQEIQPPFWNACEVLKNLDLTSSIALQCEKTVCQCQLQSKFEYRNWPQFSILWKLSISDIYSTTMNFCTLTIFWIFWTLAYLDLLYEL